MEFNTYQDLEAYLKHLEKFGMIFGLGNIQAILASLGNPHHTFKSIHIAGSNGKGSVAAMIQQTLSDSGFRCGLYTSPHLQRFTERFKIDGKEITKAGLLKHAVHVMSGIKKDGIPEGFTYFDFTTAMAFDYFAQENVDMAVIETGLGGRLDSTNVLKPEICVITPISMEHTQFLGDTLEAIASEKAGIIKINTPVVIGKQPQPALRVLIKKAKQMSAHEFVFDRDFSVTIHGDTFDYQQGDLRLKGLKTSLLGKHQKENAAIAICTLLALKECAGTLSGDTIRTSLRHVHWPGRGELFENTSDSSIRLMLDGAHNPGGAEILTHTITTLKFNKLHIMIGILGDKDIEAIAERLLSLADHVTVAVPQNERAPKVESLARRIRPFLSNKASLNMAGSIPEGFPMATAALREGDLLVITGSLYTVGEALDIIERDKAWKKTTY